MVRNLSAALVAVLLLAAPGVASAQSTWTSQRVLASQRFDGVSFPHDNERYCYLPSSPCDNQHRLAN
jgi:hypothetical protein